MHALQFPFPGKIMKIRPWTRFEAEKPGIWSRQDGPSLEPAMNCKGTPNMEACASGTERRASDTEARGSEVGSGLEWRLWESKWAFWEQVPV